MSFGPVLDMARRGRLYPSCIFYGTSLEERKQAAVEVGRTLLCERPSGSRPCPAEDPDPCTHCRRLEWPGEKAAQFHPDFHVLERDLRTATSVDATRAFLGAAYSSPFEARGQIFVVAEAETLSPGAADALLKLLEEPPTRTPRHFILLAPSRLDLLVTLRSRSLSVYLGSPESLDSDAVELLAADFGHSLDGLLSEPSAIYLLTAAQALAGATGWEDPRSRKPWAMASAAVLRALETRQLEPAVRRNLLELAEELLGAPRIRRRGIGHERILEGLLARYLASWATARQSAGRRQ